MTKEEYARRVRMQIRLHDQYRAHIRDLIDEFEAHAIEGLIPREYLDALHNCMDVTDKRGAR